MADVIKGLSAGDTEIREFGESLNGHTVKLEDCRRRIKALFDELLTDANWSNHDSRRFKRHYERGDKKLGRDLSALEAMTSSALDIASRRYQALEEDVDQIFDDSFWRESAKTRA